ncbi:hypothetical protein AAVH_01416 [Aphelenchoides avenae]|nr:hypothetical protein AAVH_01416 [Aphelenchus avenae]
MSSIDLTEEAPVVRVEEAVVADLEDQAAPVKHLQVEDPVDHLAGSSTSAQAELLEALTVLTELNHFLRAAYPEVPRLVDPVPEDLDRVDLAEDRWPTPPPALHRPTMERLLSEEVLLQQSHHQVGQLVPTHHLPHRLRHGCHSRSSQPQRCRHRRLTLRHL